MKKASLGKFRIRGSAGQNVLCVHRMAAGIFILREYLVHYLQTSRNRIFRACGVGDEVVARHILQIPPGLQKEMELRLLLFNPNRTAPPLTAIRISLDYFSPAIARLIYQPGTLHQQGGFAAIQICGKDDSETKAPEEFTRFSAIWLLLDSGACRGLQSVLPVDSVFFHELSFELQIQEVFRLYAGNELNPPSLN